MPLTGMFSKKKTGPKYTVDVVSRDAFLKTDVDDEHNGRRVVDALQDPETGEYLIVTAPKKAKA